MHSDHCLGCWRRSLWFSEPGLPPRNAACAAACKESAKDVTAFCGELKETRSKEASLALLTGMELQLKKKEKIEHAVVFIIFKLDFSSPVLKIDVKSCKIMTMSAPFCGQQSISERHNQGWHAWQQFQIHHEPAFFCYSRAE